MTATQATPAATTPVPAAHAGRLPALTGLRVIPSLWVVFGHFGRPFLPHWMQHALGQSTNMVDVFFVLSGFLLGYAYTNDAGLTVGRGRFVVSRLARLYPAYVLGLALALGRFDDTHPGGAHAAAKTGVIVIASLLMVQAWVPNGAAMNDPAWSLSNEMFFYVVLAVTGTWLWTRVSLRARVIGLTVLAVLSTVLITQVGTGDGNYHSLSVVRLPILRVAPFLLAAVVGSQLHRIRPRLPRGHLMTAVQLALVVALVGVIQAVHAESAYGHLLASAVSLGLVLCVASGEGVIPAALNVRAMQRLGDASYGVYIYQVGVYYLFAAAFGHTDLQHGWQFAVYVVLLIALALVSARTFEPWARRLIMKRVPTQRRRQPVEDWSASAARP